MFYSARFGVTEIGEKEKMKSKLLATLVVLVLLCGTFAMAIQFSPKVKADYTLYHLNVYADPSVVPPSAGTGDYTPGTLVQLNFTDPVIIDDAKYVFSYWDIDNGTWTGSSNPLKYVTMNADHNVTAHYNTQYKFTVSYPWNALWMESFTPWIWQETGPGTGFVAGSGANGTYWAWIPKYEKVQAGISSPEFVSGDYPPFGVPWIRGRYLEEVVIFTNWTNLGYYMSGQYAWSKACQINMTGPKSATMAMKMDYWLWVKSNQAPTPPGQGWYDKDTPVTLTANKIVVNWAREWRIDHWEVDGISRGQYVNPIIVNMNTNHTASAFYNCWVFIYLDDDIGNASGIRDTGKWYLEGVPTKFTALPNPPIDSGHQWRFAYWRKFGSGWTNASNPVWITLDATWAGYKLQAIYYMQYKLTLLTEPVGVATIPGAGWYDAGTVITPGPTAPDPVNIVPDKSRYKFYKWVRTSPPGWEGVVGATTIPSITMDQPKTFVAKYDYEWHRRWYAQGSGIVVTGFPGEDWQKNGTLLAWIAPATDDSGNFAFWYWVIDGDNKPEGDRDIDVMHDHYITGTAYYANKTKIFMNPPTHTETAHAYCNPFDVTVYATNFEANRHVSGEPMDIYAFDIKIKWNPALIELKSVSLNLAEFFKPNPYQSYVMENVPGAYRLIATVKGNYTGFSGTKAIFTMSFHVIYDPCYDKTNETWIEFDPTHRLLSNHLEHSIGPELGWQDCKYKIQTVKPVVEVRNAADHTNTITVHRMLDPSTEEPEEFDVEVYLNYGVKVRDYNLKLSFNNIQIKAMSVIISDYLKPPYTIYSYTINNPAGTVSVNIQQDPSVPLQNCSGVLFTVRFRVIKGDYYTMGPHGLTSDIKIIWGYLSVYCPTYKLQEVGGLLGTKDATYVYNPIPGDLDFDGVVTVLDMQLIIDNYGKTGTAGANYDVTYNGVTDLYDLVFVARRFHAP